MAKKNNSSAEEIDLTTFNWVTAGTDAEIGRPGCGGCHPGGGGLELDRDGLRYDNRLRNSPRLADTFDGDYFESKWDKSGVIEADCLLCHLPGYLFKERVRSLAQLNYQWAVVAGSGVGLVRGAVEKGEEPRVIYNSRFFNEDGKISLNLETSPRSENCLFCHGLADMRKRGFSWNDHSNHDIHNARDIKCTACHPGNIEHQLAKGRENLSTVRDDLDGTIQTCSECHHAGYMGANQPEHSTIRPNHLERLACEVCHIPQLGRASALGLDVSTGKVRLYPRGEANKVGGLLKWYPEVNMGPDDKLYPVNAFRPNVYTNLSTDDVYIPLFAKEIAKAYRTVDGSFKQENVSQPLINTPAEITTMLKALTITLVGNPRFDQVKPCYHSDGIIYQLDRDGSLVMNKDRSWASEVNVFNVSHNVAPTQMALGAKGCSDCHLDRAEIFSGWLGKESDSGMHRGQPFAMIQHSKQYFLNQLHRYNSAKRYLTPLLFGAVFVLVLFRENRIHRFKTKSNMEQTRSTRLLPIVALVLLVRNISFFVLSSTGLLFFFNYNNILHTVFSVPGLAVTIHWGSGIVFVFSIITCLALRGKVVPGGKSNICNIGFGIGGGMVLIMLLTGAGILFRNNIPSELFYVFAISHIVVAFVMIASYTAKTYYTISRWLY